MKTRLLRLSPRSIQNCFYPALLLLGGCSSGPSRSSTEYVEDIAQHAENHHGQPIASRGQLLSLRPEGSGSTLRVATANYRHLFELHFPQDTGTLHIGQELSFLGKFRGIAPMPEAYSGRIIVIDALALKPVGDPLAVVAGSEDLANSWLHGSLDLTAGLTAIARPAAMERSISSTPTEHFPIAPSLSAAPPSDRNGTAPSKALKQILEDWDSLTEAERADFLQRIHAKQ